MQRIFASLLTLTALTIPGSVYAQATDPGSSQPAPISRAPMRGPAVQAVQSTQPVRGVWLRSDAGASVSTVSANAGGAEIRIEHGRANLEVFHPADNAQILVDLPGGQTSIVKDGLYTFNADTNTMRVLRGEADAYPTGAAETAKGVKVKEDHQLVFGAAAGLKSAEVDDPRQLSAAVLPTGPMNGQPGRGMQPGGRGDGPGYGPGYGYAAGPYGDGPYVYPYPYPYYAYGYPYGYGYPFGFGFGFYGGYYGGFRGGFGRR